MRVLVCGSRHFTDRKLLGDVLDELNRDKGITEIIQGGARGADRLSKDWANKNSIPQTEYEADWDVSGKRAGPIRNERMLREGKPEMVVAFPTKDSRGTRHMISISEKAGVPVKIVEIANANTV